MTSEPLVSVIVPCYNQGSVLAEAVDSALAQTYQHREVIVIDDGSTDDTAAIAASYGPQIRLIRQENRGLPAARNAGIACARGTLMGLLDADDRWLPRKLEVEVPWFADPAVGLVHGSYRKFPATFPGAGEVRKARGERTGFHGILGFNLVGAPVSALFRRSVFDRAGRFDESLRGIEDWDLWIRLSALSGIIASDALTAEYRLSAESVSRKYEEMYRCLLQVIEKNRFHHGDCAACRRAVRKARQHANAYYDEMISREAFRALARGERLHYLRLRLRGLLRNPRAVRRVPTALVRRLRAGVAGRVERSDGGRA
jgi:glycosyltransferase involved in cell wall biosynthesis